MRATEARVGDVYTIRGGGTVSRVVLVSASGTHGYVGKDVDTDRRVHMNSARRLDRNITGTPAATAPTRRSFLAECRRADESRKAPRPAAPKPAAVDPAGFTVGGVRPAPVSRRTLSGFDYGSVRAATFAVARCLAFRHGGDFRAAMAEVGHPRVAACASSVARRASVEETDGILGFMAVQYD